MKRHFTLEYWIDDGWYIGKLKEIPGVFSQGESLDELEENDKFETDLERFKKVMLEQEPFRSMGEYINIYGVFKPSLSDSEKSSFGFPLIFQK